MAVNSTATFHRYKPGSAQLPEALPGIVFSALDDIDVFLENADGGASQPLTLGVHYSLALPSEHSDGTITAIGTYDADDVFHVERNSRIDQPTVFDPFQVVPGRAVERGLDRNALWAQEAQREISRSLRMQRGLPTLEVGAIEEGDAVGLINGRLRGFSNTVAAATSAAAAPSPNKTVAMTLRWPGSISRRSASAPTSQPVYITMNCTRPPVPISPHSPLRPDTTKAALGPRLPVVRRS